MNILELLSMSAKDVGYQLTAYEKYGSVGIEELKEFALNEIKDNEIDLNDYNNFLSENNYYDDEIFYNDKDFFDTYFNNDPMEAARATFYGDWNYNHEYVRFNGYGNLESSDFLYELMDLSEEYWENFLDNEIDWEDEEIQEIINICNDLVKQGY